MASRPRGVATPVSAGKQKQPKADPSPKARRAPREVLSARARPLLHQPEVLGQGAAP